MSGSFWKFSNGFGSASNISNILENYNINKDDRDHDISQVDDEESDAHQTTEGLATLHKLFDENDLLQELLSNNSMLLEFLRDDQILEYLFDLVILEGNLFLKTKGDSNSDKSDVEKDLEKLKISQESSESDESKNQESDEKSEYSHDDEEEKQADKSQEINEDDDDDEEDDDEEEDDEDETEEEKYSRYATLATEILSADVWSLTDTVMESTNNLNKLWGVLESKTTLSINLSTYFMKIMEHLLDMKCDEMITYLIENQPRLVERFMNHLSNPPLMDFLLKLISTDKPDNSTGIIDFLQNQHLIPLLIKALDPDDEGAVNDVALIRQSSAADLLKALITISANSTTDNSTIGPNELTRELVSYDCMKTLCQMMLKGGYALANGVGIIIEIIRKNNSDYDILPILYITLESHPPTGRDPIYLGYLLQVFGEEISKFNDILSSKRESDVVPDSLLTPFGEIEPLGFERFKICELIAELLHCSNMALLNDNKGFNVVKERNELREKMKEYDPISFKYNEVIVLPNENEKDKNTSPSSRSNLSDDDDLLANDTIDSFNSKNEDSILHNQNYEQDIEEPHENANLTEDQLRANPVIGDQWKIALYDTQIITNMILMFFKFPWNNFLHNVVFDIVQQVLNGSMDIGFNKFLAIDLFDGADLTNKIIYGQEYCIQFEKEHNGLRLGYMGHLTLIAEEVFKFIQSYPISTLSEIIDQKVSEPGWEDYVNNVLYDTREKYNAILGGGDDDDEEEGADDGSNTFDEGSGEVIEDSEYKAGFLFDNDESGPKEFIPHGESIEEEDEEEVDEEEETLPRKAKEAKLSSKLSSDESESEDEEDHFSKYMSQELVNTASTEVSNSVGNKNSDDESSSDDEINEKPYLTNAPLDMEHTVDDDDEYIDPNDDGKSYKKFNPLYDGTGSLLDETRDLIPSEEDGSSESSTSSDSDEEPYDIGDNEKEHTKLTRAASKG
ncbi:sporulation-induced protein [Yamadazyma tenuis]|uniref:sporulation-induced protein n=1 Tax=Candida tenuis TaxID=2315449 RepID=UPI0027A2F8AD|nr:sporulation-induced protein [Yamadazyma tenuis]